MRAKIGRLLRRADRRLGVPVWGCAARGGLIPVALAIALLSVAAMPVEAGVAATGAAPDPAPAAKGSAATPEPDPFRAGQRFSAQDRARDAAARAEQLEREQRDGVDSRSDKLDSGDRAEADGVGAAHADAAEEGDEKVAAGRTTATKTTKQNTKRSPTVVAAAAVDGGPLLLGGLGLAALALASGSLLFLVSRSGGLEARP